MFTNPPGDHAARLIEAAGLKGFRIGDASVSRQAREFHHQPRAGDGAPTSEQLIAHVQRDGASACTACALQPEVRIVGEPA